MRGRTQAVSVTTLCAILSFLLPPFTYLSGAPVGLVTLARGPMYGMQIVAASLVLMGVLAWAALDSPILALVFAFGVWGPVWLCGLVLRIARSQTALLLVIGSLAALFVVGMYIVTGDPTVWWRAWLQTVIQSAGGTGAGFLDDELIEHALPYMNATVAAGMTLGLMATVLLARWWQAILYNPGGFKVEFYSLRLPRFMTLVAGLLLVLAIVVEGLAQMLVRDLLFVAVMMYLFQGLAVIHQYVAKRNLSVGWLVALYGLMLLVPPQTVLLVACVGVADTWLKFGGSGGPGTGTETEDR